MSDDLSVEKSGQNSSVGIRGRDRFAVELVPVRNEEELPHVKVEQRRRLGRLVKSRTLLAADAAAGVAAVVVVKKNASVSGWDEGGGLGALSCKRDFSD